ASAFDDATSDREPVAPAVERKAWLEVAHHRIQSFDLGARDVGRVRHHELEAFVRFERLQKIANCETNSEHRTESDRILPRHRDRAFGHVDSGHAPSGSILRKRDRDASGARTNIECAPELITVTCSLERHFDQDFGFRAWDEHAWV